MSPESGNIPGLFTDQGEAYARFAPESFSWKYIEKPALDRYLAGSINRETRVVDAGCGVGRTVKYLVDAGVSLPNILGVDLNPDMIDVTLEAIPGVKVIRADIENLPIPNDSQDLVLCTHVLHFLDNEKYLSAMKTFRRVLRHGGVLITIITHPVRAARKDLSHYFERRWVIDQNPWGLASPLFFRTTSDLVNLALEAGFVLEIFDELEVDLNGFAADPLEYQRYTTGPSRLALKLRK